MSIVLASESTAQYKSVHEVTISFAPRNSKIRSIFHEIESKTDFRFSYDQEDIPLQSKVDISSGKVSVARILTEISRKTTLMFRQHNNNISVGPKSVDQGKRISIKLDVLAQVSGKVTDENGNGLPGVSVVVKGTSTGTTTDTNGNFTLDMPGDAILVFSFIGYTTQEISVGTQTIINVTMVPNIEQLEEIVIVGYGSQKKTNITGANVFIEMSDVLGDRPVNNSARVLQGAVPGLQIDYGSGRPGTGTNINIRGFESINGGSPLILMDNVPVQLSDVNPRDIESVSVLKDASASSIYGARAAFGVILITTKKAGKNEPFKFSYSTTMGVSKPVELLQPASPGDFVRSLDDWGIISHWTGQDVDTWLDFVKQYEANPAGFPDGFAEDNGVIYPLQETDNIGEFLGDNGFTQNHNFNVSGGSERSAYRLSFGYSDDDGIMVTDKDAFKRYNVNSFLTTDVLDKLTASLITNYRSSVFSTPKSDYSKAVFAYSYLPQGNHEFPDGTSLPYNTPANIARFGTANTTEENNIRLTGKLDFKPLNGLTVTGEYTFENRVRNRKNIQNGPEFVDSKTFVRNVPVQTSYFRENRNIRYNALNLYARYEKNIRDHTFSTLVGFNRESEDRETFSGTERGLINPDLPAFDLTENDNTTVDDLFGSWAVLGYFGRLNYHYRGKYFLEMNGRYDGSSRFPDGDRFGFFPSFSAGWQLMSEPFMDPLKNVISEMKLRASWGEVGNQVVLRNGAQNYYPYLPQLIPTQASWMNEDSQQRYTTLSTPDLVSESFSWERIQTLNLGIDAEFLDNRLSTTFDWYIRKTLEMLGRVDDLPSILGTSPPSQNVADLETKGWELQVTWRDKIGAVSYNIGFNLFDNTAEITNYNNEEGVLSDWYIGRQPGEIWGYVTDGYFTVDDFVDGTLDADLTGGVLREGIPSFENMDPNPGDIKFKDLDGDGIISPGASTLTDPGDRMIIGNSTRRYQFGIFGGAEFRGFDLSFRIAGVGQRDVNMSRTTGGGNLNRAYFPFITEFENVFEHALDHWTPDNTNGFFPRVYGPGEGNNYGRSRSVQTKYLVDGAYWTLQNITIGYTLPKGVLDKIHIDNLRIFISGENLINHHHAPEGLHPEFTTQSNNGGVYPYLKSYAAGLNLTL